jgi:hypothetical protein
MRWGNPTESKESTLDPDEEPEIRLDPNMGFALTKGEAEFVDSVVVPRAMDHVLNGIEHEADPKPEHPIPDD